MNNMNIKINSPMILKNEEALFLYNYLKFLDNEHIKKLFNKIRNEDFYEIHAQKDVRSTLEGILQLIIDPSQFIDKKLFGKNNRL
jgi:hypothetical protein